MIFARVDAAKREVTLVSVPARYSAIRWTMGALLRSTKCTTSGGAAASIKAVSRLTGMPINHYAEVHFSEFQEMVDKLGGITVDVPVEVSYKDALTGDTGPCKPGVQTLNGQQAQIFARARHEYGENQEAKRQSNIRQILMAIVEKVLREARHGRVAGHGARSC